jgi:hypothetical protein
MIKISNLVLSICVLGAASCPAATLTWTGAGDGALWNDSGNWSPATLPVSSSDVVFTAATPTGLLAEARTIASLSFTHSTGVSNITAVGDSILQVNGLISNSSSSAAEFDIALTAGASATWSGSIKYLNVVNFGSNAVTLSGSHTFTGSNINFNIVNASTYGRLLGSFTSTTAFSGSINIDASAFASSAVVGDTFDFTTGDFSGVSLANVHITALSGGLVWNTSNFLTQGILTVSAVPEPATYAVLLGFVALGFGAARRRRKA